MANSHYYPQLHGSGACIGVISDTHGLLRPQVSQLFTGMDFILHAGDIGSPDVLSALRQLAPVFAVRGNNDSGAWADVIPDTATVVCEGTTVFLIHDAKELAPSSTPKDVHVVISGHSHRPSLENRGSTLFLNPGSAGPRRFKLPVSVARLTIASAGVSGELINLTCV